MPCWKCLLWQKWDAPAIQKAFTGTKDGGGGWTGGNSPSLEELQVPWSEQEMHPVLCLGLLQRSFQKADLPPLAETWLSFPSHHICLYKGGLPKNKQKGVCWEFHPGLEAQDTDLPSSWRLKINRWSQKGKEKVLGDIELVEQLMHKRPLIKSHVVVGRFMCELKHGASC